MNLGPTARRKKGWMNLKVSSIIDETPDTKTFYMVDADDGGRAFDYLAGQYLTFRFDDLGSKPLVRSYTMSSSPCQNESIAVTVKRVEGGVVSNWFCDAVQNGSILRARGPIGKFCWDPTRGCRHLVMVAAGSGVTPFISIIREYAQQLGQKDAPQSLTLLVAYRSEKDIICEKELQEFKQIPHTNIHITLTRGQNDSQEYWRGRPDDAMLDRMLNGKFKDTLYMTCGPNGLMETVVGYLRRHGVPEEHIEQESFA